ncbi:TPA: hypothetical protein ACF5HI_004127 [Salmonella enterica]
MSRNLAKKILINSNSHVFIIGCTGAGKSTLLHEINIPNSKYFDFVELTKKSKDKPYLYEGNFPKFESDLINSTEKNLIIDSVEFPSNMENSKLLSFLRIANNNGKRLIIVTSPYSASPILCMCRLETLNIVSAFIHLERNYLGGNHIYICDIEKFRE